MTITVRRDRTAPMRHVVHVRAHEFPVDVAPADGGQDAGPDPHDLYDSALGACIALTTLWYARRRGMPVDGLEVTVARDAAEERAGTYRLAATLAVGGALTDAQRQDLLRVADKCPVHRLMHDVETVITTTLAPAPSGDPT
jgi:putative redox protein